mgnify:CR=1 FL=1
MTSKSNHQREIIKQLTENEWKGEVSTPKKIIGKNNLLSVSWLNRGIEISRCVARIITPKGYGTGFLISPDFLITNNHVIGSVEEVSECIAEFNFQDDWNGLSERSQRFKLDASQFQTNPDLDYTLVRVQDNPGDLFGYIDIFSSRIPEIGENLTIIQHPLGGKKQICLTDNHVASVFKHLVQYTTDTEPGSSGSPVFDQQWRLVSLHHKGGLLPGQDGSSHFVNEGILFNKIVNDARQFLGLNDPLVELVTGELKNDLEDFISSTPDLQKISKKVTSITMKHPKLEPALKNWVNLHQQTDEFFDPVTVAGIAGVLTGAGIAHWAHTTSEKEISVGVSVSISDELPNLFRSIENKETLPSEYIGLIFSNLPHNPIITKQVTETVNTDEVLPIAAFFYGVGVGAAAYKLGK